MFDRFEIEKIISSSLGPIVLTASEIGKESTKSRR